MTRLLKGQAVKVRLVSPSVTAMRGSACFRARAALAPPKPPPTTTTRGAPCASAGAERPTAAATVVEARNSRRLRAFIATSRGSLLLGVPFGDGLDLGVRVSLGKPVHHRAFALPGLEALHLRNGLGGAAPGDTRDGRVDAWARGVAAGAGRGAGGRNRRGRSLQGDRGEDDRNGRREERGAHDG